MDKKCPRSIKKTLEKSACYVIITCSHPSNREQMQVEMTYEGDPSLVGYLLQSAQSMVDCEVNDHCKSVEHLISLKK